MSLGDFQFGLYKVLSCELLSWVKHHNPKKSTHQLQSTAPCMELGMLCQQRGCTQSGLQNIENCLREVPGNS